MYAELVEACGGLWVVPVFGAAIVQVLRRLRQGWGGVEGLMSVFDCCCSALLRVIKGCIAWRVYWELLRILGC